MRFTALPTTTVCDLQNGGLDAYGAIPERAISDGQGNPCRHCLRDIPEGVDMLILAHRPFTYLQPYAETGPIFLCADECPSGDTETLPEILQTSPDYLIKGYSTDERIVYGTGAIVASQKIRKHAGAIFANPKVAFIHIRSARNNCYQARIDHN
jgi:hypothetical protein